MTPVLFPLLTILLIGIALFIKSQLKRETDVYYSHESVLNQSEAAFFHEIKSQLPDGYYVFPKMRIADMLGTPNGGGYYRRRNRILPKHIDFLICDSNFKPMVAIELNGSSHLRPDRIERDKEVAQIFKEAELPLEFIEVGSNFEEIVSRIKSYIQS